jgi:predicted metal-dependent peptidase
LGGAEGATLSSYDAGEAKQSVKAQSGDYSVQVTVAIDLSGSMSTQSLNNLKVIVAQHFIVK